MITTIPCDLFSVWEPDPIGVILGTGMMHFVTKRGMDGLANIRDNRIDVLAVSSLVKGQGMFRQFIADLKQEFTTVCVWEDWNPIVGAALQRYGFSPEIEIQGDGETLTGWRWDKPSLDNSTKLVGGGQ